MGVGAMEQGTLGAAALRRACELARALPCTQGPRVKEVKCGVHSHRRGRFMGEGLVPTGKIRLESEDLQYGVGVGGCRAVGGADGAHPHLRRGGAGARAGQSVEGLCSGGQREVLGARSLSRRRGKARPHAAFFCVASRLWQRPRGYARTLNRIQGILTCHTERYTKSMLSLSPSALFQ